LSNAKATACVEERLLAEDGAHGGAQVEVPCASDAALPTAPGFGGYETPPKRKRGRPRKSDYLIGSVPVRIVLPFESLGLRRFASAPPH